MLIKTLKYGICLFLFFGGIAISANSCTTHSNLEPMISAVQQPICFEIGKGSKWMMIIASFIFVMLLVSECTVGKKSNKRHN